MQGDVGLRQRYAGAQNAVLMQVVGERIKDSFAIVTARTDQRHFAGKIDALFNDAFAVAVFRQCRFFARTQTPLAAAVVTADATFYNRQFTEL